METKEVSPMKERGSWAIGGGTMLGLGVGFFMLPNALAFVGCILGGIGVGLLIAAFISK